MSAERDRMLVEAVCRRVKEELATVVGGSWNPDTAELVRAAQGFADTIARGDFGDAVSALTHAFMAGAFFERGRADVLGDPFCLHEESRGIICGRPLPCHVHGGGR